MIVSLLHHYDINAGVLQGSVLRPTLFLVYINVLPDGALSRIGIYAYSSIQTSESSLIPLKMNDIGLPKSSSFRLLRLVFTPKFD